MGAVEATLVSCVHVRGCCLSLSCWRPLGASAESWAASPCDGTCFNVLCPSPGSFFSPGGQPAPPGPPASRAKSQSLDPFADLGDLSSSLQGEGQGVSGCAVLGLHREMQSSVLRPLPLPSSVPRRACPSVPKAQGTVTLGTAACPVVGAWGPSCHTGARSSPGGPRVMPACGLQPPKADPMPWDPCPWPFGSSRHVWVSESLLFMSWQVGGWNSRLKVMSPGEACWADPASSPAEQGLLSAPEPCGKPSPSAGGSLLPPAPRPCLALLRASAGLTSIPRYGGPSATLFLF